MTIRASGILLHISCLPARFGIGDMGPWAYRFADFLYETRQTYWQIIPLTPPNPVHYSPYHSPSAFAGNSLLISPEVLVQEGLLDASAVESIPSFPEDRVNYPLVFQFKEQLICKAYERFRTASTHTSECAEFCDANAGWLEDYGLFRALSTRFQDRVWGEWPEQFRDRNPEALARASEELRDAIDKEKFVQYLFFKQWSALKTYCNRKGIQIIGDLPVYIDYNSADVWTHPELFKLDPLKRPYVVAGVPPDYFSSTGQLWGHPIYDWDALKRSGYSWWLDRIQHNMAQCDLIRIDHFRGFLGFWEVPASEKTALNGKWVDGPGSNFFEAMLRRFPSLRIIAEDLGVITPDVREAMCRFGFPGMKVLLFAFGEDFAANPYIPHNIPRNSIVFTGTHDNNTAKGWFRREATPEDRKRFFTYIGRETGEDEVAWEMCRLAMMTVADTVILPIQDILGLAEEARMNTPSRKQGNWLWRLSPNLITEQVIRKLRLITETYGRA